MSPELTTLLTKVTCDSAFWNDGGTRITSASARIDLEALISCPDTDVSIPQSPVLPVYSRNAGIRFANNNATNGRTTPHNSDKDNTPRKSSRNPSIRLPIVTFNPSSLIFADGIKTETNQDNSGEVHTDLPEDANSEQQSNNPPTPIFTLMLSSDASPGGPCPKKNTESDSGVSFSEPDVASNWTLLSTDQQRSAKVCSSLPTSVFTCDSLPKTILDGPKTTSSAGLKEHKVGSMVSFDESSLLERSEIPGMDDEQYTSTTENDSKQFKPDHLVVPHSPSLDYGFQNVENNVGIASADKPRSILKKQNPKHESSDEKIVTECLKLLCETAIDDREQTYALICRSAKEVFMNLCFEQFFHAGECISSTCDENHYYKPHIFPHPSETLWYASLYVICHATQPNRQIVENLIQHYTTKRNMIKTLVFAKCIARVKDSDRLELAHYMVNMLSGIIPRRDTITVILMLNFSYLSTFQYNILLEGLGVFERNTTHYSELMTFLNFRGHVIPIRLLAKLMENAIDYVGSKNDLVESIAGFLERLPPRQMEEVKSAAVNFLNKFRLPEVGSQVNQIGEDEVPNERITLTQKKGIRFAAEPEVREFETFTIPQEIPCNSELDDVGFSDEEHSDNAELNEIDFYDSPKLQTETIVRVFGESCCTWILSGRCVDPVCRLIHYFSKDSLIGLSSKEVYVASDFIINKAASPSLEILKIFIEFLAESNETAMVLRFRKCASKLSTRDSLMLTNLVILLLEKQIGRWEAIQNVLVPDVLDSGNLNDDQFFFDHKLIYLVMSEAISTKTSMLRYVTNAILQRLVMLPPCDEVEFVEMTSNFTHKFLIAGRDLPPYPDILPVDRIPLDGFASNLKLALYQGVPNKYFVATAMLKLAILGSLRDQALDVLYTFLLSNYDRARILTQLLENCKYFDADMKKSVSDLFGAVGLSTSIRLYEGENIEGTAEMFCVLKQFKFDIFSLLESHGNMTELNLAVIYCSVIADTVHRNETIDVFLQHCVDPYLKCKSLVCPPELVKSTARMFWVFASNRLVEESLKLYNGIIVRQRSLMSPLNILEYVEPTLRCTFHQPCDPKIRRETLKLYLDVVDSGSSITFHKVTHRSVFLVALMEITYATQKAQLKGHINIIHPLVKKILIKCIGQEVYPEFSPSQITLLSSMTTEEIKVYILWWFFLFVRARKRQSIDFLPPVRVTILRDCIQDDSRLPVHHSLHSVSVGITDCAERLALFIRHTIPEPFPPYANIGGGQFELDPTVVRGLTQTSISLMKQHGYIDSEFDRMCTFCFDKLDVNLSDKL